MAIPGAGAEIKIDRPLNYPNPFKPGHGQGTTIGYMLDTTTSNVEVTIYIYNLNGTLLWKRAYIQNPGYQQVSFSGISDLGEILGNGVYLYQIVSGGKVLGKGKMAVLE